LLAGYVMQKNDFDYGYDGFIKTFRDNGEVENGDIYVQLKSTDILSYSEDKRAFKYDLSVKDLELWLLNRDVLILVLYNPAQNQACYIELQDYFSKNSIVTEKSHKFVRVFIPKDNIVSSESVKLLRIKKNLDSSVA
jgi:hypothetical protein